MFLDIIPRFKAALEVETFEDLICRITKEFTAVFKFFGSLEKYSLTNPNLNLIKVFFSLFKIIYNFLCTFINYYNFL